MAAATLQSGLLSARFTGNGNELGVDLCSHKHFVIVDKFINDIILRNLKHANLSYEVTQCRRETPVGQTMREYEFTVLIGKVECPFVFKVKDVKAEVTYSNFSPKEVQDFNTCQKALEIAYPDIEESNLAPIFDGIDAEIAQERIDASSDVRDLFESKPETLDIGTQSDIHTDLTADFPELGLDKLFEVDEEGIIHKHTEGETVEEITETLETKFHNQKAGEQPEEAYTPRYNPNDERAIGGVPGGWSKCKDRSIEQVQKMLVMLSNSNVLKAVQTYTQNIAACTVQVVAGMHFKVELHYNDEVCNMEIFEDIKGEPSIPSNFQTSADCATYFTKSYVDAHPSLIAPHA